MSCSVLSLKSFGNGNTIGWSINIPAYLPLNPCFWLRQWPTAHSHLDILGCILLRFWSCGRLIFGSMVQHSKFKRHYWAWGWGRAEVVRVWSREGPSKLAEFTDQPIQTPSSFRHSRQQLSSSRKTQSSSEWLLLKEKRRASMNTTIFKTR